MTPNDFSWCMFQFEEEGCQVLVRALDRMPDQELIDAHPVQTTISWEYTPNETGFPEEAELLRITELENLLVAGVTEVSVLTLTLTGNGRRQWWFYAREVDEFVDALNRALSGYPRFPIQINTCEDMGWESMHELIGVAEYEINEDGDLV